jgi:hypothetical protein
MEEQEKTAEQRWAECWNRRDRFKDQEISFTLDQLNWLADRFAEIPDTRCTVEFWVNSQESRDYPSNSPALHL